MYLHRTDHDGFTCDVCGLVYKQPLSFRKHLKSHGRQGEQSLAEKYQKVDCKYCDKSVYKGKTLRHHCYVEHREEYLQALPYPCIICYIPFKTTEELEQHQSSHMKCQVSPQLSLSLMLRHK